MTTLAHRSMLGGPRNGGVAARRAVIRWAWRMFRREWRQQLLVVTLLTVAVAAAIGSITIAHNAVPADDGDFGSANQVLTFDSSDPRKLAGGSRLRQEVVRSDRCHRPPLSACPRQRRDGGLPIASPGAPTAANCSLSVVAATRRPRAGRRDRWSGGVSSARDRVKPGARRAPTDRRGHRREPEQAE